ncbi:MAG: hypothetical protein JXR52_01060, partial [Bacteroidales bacterium]|nr:hypothetical protein [Bacteroidales bacterium]
NGGGTITLPPDDVNDADASPAKWRKRFRDGGTSVSSTEEQDGSLATASCLSEDRDNQNDLFAPICPLSGGPNHISFIFAF